jgi:hypothetical protein
MATALALKAHATEPVNSNAFNVSTSIDLAQLTPQNFYDVLGPAAKAEESIVF